MIRRRPRRGVRAWQAVAAMAALLISLALDGPAYHGLRVEGLREDGLYQVLRQAGYFPAWLIVGAVFWLLDTTPGRVDGRVALATPRPGHHRAGLVVLSAGVSGLAAEGLKIVFRRLRPGETGGSYGFRALWDRTLDGSGLGLPSGHTAVAFGGAVMVALLVPRLRWVVLGVAAGCGVTRLMAGAHFLSDVTAGALLASGVALALHRAGEGPRRGPAGGLCPP